MSEHVHSVLTGELTYFDAAIPISDGHADPLREWTEDGDATPEGWFAVRAATRHGDDLYLIREMHGELLGNGMKDYKSGVWYTIANRPIGTIPVALARTVWWTPSEELACEVARQFRDGERRAVQATRADMNADVWHRRFRPWTAIVYEHAPRPGVLRHARLVRTYERTAPHRNPEPWEDGYNPPMKTWGSPDQDADAVITRMGRRGIWP